MEKSYPTAEVSKHRLNLINWRRLAVLETLATKA
jgi:hypothetical protein